MRFLKWGCLILLFWNPPALSGSGFAGWQLSFLGGLYYSAPTERQSQNDLRWTGLAAPIWGPTIAYSLSGSPFEFETGLFFQSEKSERESNGSNLIQTFRHLQIPLVVRFQFDPQVSLGLGGYYAFLQDSVPRDPDAGLVINARALLSLAEPVYLILDARYQHGIANRARIASDLLNTRSIQMMIGLQYQIRETGPELPLLE